MNNIQAHRPSAVNRYLEIAKQTKLPLAIYFNDGEITPSCLILESDSLNLLIKTLDFEKDPMLGEEFVITRASIKKIGTALEHNHNH